MNLPKPHNMMRASLAAVLIGAFMLAIFWLMNKPVPGANEQLVIFMLGVLAGMAKDGAGFYFATSKGSSDKTDIIAQSAPPGMPPAPPDDGPCQHERPDEGQALFGGARP